MEHATQHQHEKVAILVGGGPAPGINSVIGAATIYSVLQGAQVIGIQDGFKWLIEGDIRNVRPLRIDEVSRIHFQGGSCLGTSRANPTTDQGQLEKTLASLRRLDVSGLITIGGDDTAFSAMKLGERAAGKLRVVHVPKTIDNDLQLPHGMPTFGFQTARHIGVGLVKNLMVDAQTTSRWYFVVAMGRKAGHLALGIGKAAGATLTLIPEEFSKRPVPLAKMEAILAGAIIKRLSMGHSDGVAVLAEGLAELLDERELSELGDVQHDQHGNVRLRDINIGEMLAHRVGERLKQFGIKTTIVAKNIGYELRCADPIPFDMEYTRDLGYCAATFLLDNGNGAMVSIDNGRFFPIPFQDILDPTTGRTRVRMVDMMSDSYYVARQYMIRLSKDDFEHPKEVRKYAATTGISPDEFRAEFEGHIQG